jgi:hypothetical protein
LTLLLVGSSTSDGERIPHLDWFVFSLLLSSPLEIPVTAMTRVSFTFIYQLFSAILVETVAIMKGFTCEIETNIKLFNHFILDCTFCRTSDSWLVFFPQLSSPHKAHVTSLTNMFSIPCQLFLAILVETVVTVIIIM